MIILTSMGIVAYHLAYTREAGYWSRNAEANQISKAQWKRHIAPYVEWSFSWWPIHVFNQTNSTTLWSIQPTTQKHPLDPKTMKDEGFTPQNMGEITPKNEGFGFPWTLKIEFSARKWVSFPGGRSRLPRQTQYQCDLQMDLEDQANAPQWAPWAFFFFLDWSSSLGSWGGIKKR